MATPGGLAAPDSKASQGESCPAIGRLMALTGFKRTLWPCCSHSRTGRLVLPIVRFLPGCVPVPLRADDLLCRTHGSAFAPVRQAKKKESERQAQILFFYGRNNRPFPGPFFGVGPEGLLSRVAFLVPTHSCKRRS